MIKRTNLQATFLILGTFLGSVSALAIDAMKCKVLKSEFVDTVEINWKTQKAAHYHGGGSWVRYPFRGFNGGNSHDSTEAVYFFGDNYRYIAVRRNYYRFLSGSITGYPHSGYGEEITCTEVKVSELDSGI